MYIPWMGVCNGIYSQSLNLVEGWMFSVNTLRNPKITHQ
jgi:hypothetical protein